MSLRAVAGGSAAGTTSVPSGGTGVTSLTAYAPLFGGTTSTGPIQSGTVGTATQVLTSNGPGALPTFQSPAAAGGAWTFLSLVTASAAATADIETTFSSTYDAYVIVAEGITFSAASTDLNVRMKVGGAYDTGANYYFWAGQPSSANASLGTPNVANGGTTIGLTTTGNLSNGASDGGNLTMRIYNPSSTTFKKCIDWQGFLPYGASSHMVFGGGMNSSTSALTGIRLYPLSGTLSGKFRLYGISNS